MADIDIAQAMDDIAQAFEGKGMRAYGWPAENVQPPCAVVGYPEEIDLNLAFGRTGSQYTIPVYLLVGKASDRAARTQLSTMLGQVKEALGNIGGPLTARIEEVNVGGIAYLCARLDLDWLDD